jgi:SOS-response transcriptional repressor LexA
MPKPKRKLKLVAPPVVQSTRQISVSYPFGVTAKDFNKVFGITLTDNYLSSYGIHDSDVLVSILTDDLQSGDIVVLDDKSIRRFYPAPGGHTRLESLVDDELVNIYRPGEVKIIGRVLEVQRNTKKIDTALLLRPFKGGSR